ncbi:hypothetical protein EDD86DRAFT_261763 [Gorgonomyces haynaldii]|nr:hypothetical protein EDD86DRAFT_261763 [Gorgonomyces haynaldii]
MNAPKRERKKACLKCRQRKVACDGVYPSCKNCVRNKRYCEYPNESELRRRRPPPDFRKLLSIEFYERFRPSPPLGWRLAEMGELDVAFETFDRAYGLDQTKPQIQYGFIRNWASLRQPSPVLEDAMIAAGMRRFGPLYQQVSYSHMNKAIQTLLVLDHVSVFDNLGIQLLFDPIASIITNTSLESQVVELLPNFCLSVSDKV